MGFRGIFEFAFCTPRPRMLGTDAVPGAYAKSRQDLLLGRAVSQALSTTHGPWVFLTSPLYPEF